MTPDADPVSEPPRTRQLDPVEVVAWGAGAAASAAVAGGLVGVVSRSGGTWRFASIVSAEAFGVPTAACLLFGVVLLALAQRRSVAPHLEQRYPHGLAIAVGVACVAGEVIAICAVATTSIRRDHIVVSIRLASILSLTAATVLAASATWLAIQPIRRTHSGADDA